MSVGSRVVRGPDWKFEEEEEDQDGGEGFVGTITSTQKFKDGSPLPKGTVLVYWDNGFQGCYRAGQGGCYDLRILDSAPAGIEFSSHACHGCKESFIAGMRWQCAVCPNYDLCTLCYMNDVHEKNHCFIRFGASDHNTSGVDVGLRSASSKIQAKGIFSGAIVKTGHDWTSQSLGNGIVLGFASWEGVPRSAARVDWNNFCELLVRVGYQGKIDLELVENSLGPSYYKDHLPLVSLEDINDQKKQDSLLDEKPEQQNEEMESIVQSNQKPDQQKELEHELIQRLQKSGQQSDDTTSVKPPPRPPPPTLPKPSQRLRNNSSSNSNVVEQSEARQHHPTPEPGSKVKNMIKRMSQNDMGDSSGKTKAPAPAKPANRVNLSNGTLKSSKKTRPAPPPPRPQSAIFADSDNISSQPKAKEMKPSPSRTNVASLAARLGNLPLDPTKGRMPFKKIQARELICTSCDDEKASKVCFEPCGHWIEVVCVGCARKLKRCLTCNEVIDKKSTPDGSQLPEPDEMHTSNNERMKELERQLEEATRELECPICMDERSNVLFSCGHRTCMECSDSIRQDNNQCPFCKQVITERKRMF